MPPLIRFTHKMEGCQWNFLSVDGALKLKELVHVVEPFYWVVPGEPWKFELSHLEWKYRLATIRLIMIVLPIGVRMTVMVIGVVVTRRTLLVGKKAFERRVIVSSRWGKLLATPRSISTCKLPSPASRFSMHSLLVVIEPSSDTTWWGPTKS